MWLDALLSANSRAAGNILAQTFADLSGSGPKVLFFEFMGREGNKPALENDADLVRKEYERDPLILEWLVRAAYLGPVEIHRVRIIVAPMWIMASKLVSVLQARIAIRLNSLSF